MRTPGGIVYNKVCARVFPAEETLYTVEVCCRACEGKTQSVGGVCMYCCDWGVSSNACNQPQRCGTAQMPGQTPPLFRCHQTLPSCESRLVLGTSRTVGLS